MLTADGDAECGHSYRKTSALHCLIRGLVEQVLLYGKAMRPTLGISYVPPQASEQRLVERVAGTGATCKLGTAVP